MSFLHSVYASFSYWGLVVATLFFAGSLTPSLLPRHFAVQGLMSGIVLAVGYGVGVFGVWLWDYLEFRKPSEKLSHLSKKFTAFLVAVLFLWRATIWQNSIRQLMEMEPVETAYPWRVALIAGVVAIFLIYVIRGLRKSWLVVHHQVNRVVPRRISYVLSSVVVVLLVLNGDMEHPIFLSAELDHDLS